MYKIPANTLFTGQNIVFMPECHSTNTHALQLCQQPATPEGTVVITSHQTAGRGQRGNTWMVQPGMNLTLSVIYKPAFLALKDQFHLNMIASLAVHDYLHEKLNSEICVKWPNDLMADGKKICGILVENQIQGNRFVNSVIGIGLNVNQSAFDIATATSVYAVSGQSSSLPDELPRLLEKLEARYLQLRANKENELRQAYLDNLYWRDIPHLFSSAEGEFNGIIRGINEAGRLQVQVEDEIKTFDLKGIQYKA